jgi:hypothetical protein
VIWEVTFERILWRLSEREASCGSHDHGTLPPFLIDWDLEFRKLCTAKHNSIHKSSSQIPIVVSSFVGPQFPPFTRGADPHDISSLELGIEALRLKIDWSISVNLTK